MVTVLALLAMLRELFPDRPLLTAGAALLCAFQPVFTWISGGVNPDAGLIPVGAVLFWLLARAHRRGLTTPLAGAIGLTVAVAGLVKLSGFGLAPGAALGVALCCGAGATRSGSAAPRAGCPRGRLHPARDLRVLVTGGVALPAAARHGRRGRGLPVADRRKGTSGFAYVPVAVRAAARWAR